MRKEPGTARLFYASGDILTGSGWIYVKRRLWKGRLSEMGIRYGFEADTDGLEFLTA